MEEKFIAAWAASREKALKMGVRMRPVEPENAMKSAHFCLRGTGSATGFPCWLRKGIWS